MSIFGEFHIPADAFTFYETFQVEPNLVIEIQRVVATDELLTPYFWVTHISPSDFETAVDHDPSVTDVQRLDEFDEATLYRAQWADRVETLVYAYTQIGAAIMGADGHSSEWMLRMRFDDHGKLDEFHSYLDRRQIPFDLQRLYEIAHPRGSSQFGLTPKQSEAILTASKMGFFDLPREATMKDVATELGIAPQSVSDRLRRAQKTLIENALQIEGSMDHSFSGPDQ